VGADEQGTDDKTEPVDPPGAEAAATTSDADPNPDFDPEVKDETDPAATAQSTGRTRTREERTADRARRRQQAAEVGIEEPGESAVSLGPVLRHLNTVTKEMALAYRTIGVLTSERDSFRRQVYELQGLPVPEDETRRTNSTRAETKDARAEARLVKQAERAGDEPALSEEEMAEKLRAMVLRRRMIALGAIATLAVIYAIGKLNSYDWSSFSRDSLAKVQFVGPLFQVFLIGFVVYRVARVSGKAGRWLFPGDQLPKKRRR